MKVMRVDIRQRVFRSLNVFGCCLFVIFFLSACSDGTSGIEGSGKDEGTERAAAVVVGPIQDFGSVILNGKKFNTDNAEFYLRGDVGRQDDLNRGHYVTVIGTFDESAESGIANEVHFFPTITGPITQINIEDRAFNVLGRSIQVNSETLYSQNIIEQGIEGLATGMRVTVSGSQSGAGIVQASRVDAIEQTGVELNGRVRALDVDQQTFMLGTLTVDYSSVNNSTFLQNGSIVWLSGNLDSDEVLAATVLRDRSDKNVLLSGRRLELKGFVENFQAENGLMEINRRVIRLGDDTQISLPKPLSLGDGVEAVVNGIVLEDGALLASLVRVIEPREESFTGILKNVRALNGNNLNDALLAFDGLDFRVDADTTIEDSFGNSISAEMLSKNGILSVTYISLDQDSTKRLLAKNIQVEVSVPANSDIQVQRGQIVEVNAERRSVVLRQANGNTEQYQLTQNTTLRLRNGETLAFDRLLNGQAEIFVGAGQRVSFIRILFYRAAPQELITDRIDGRK